MNTDPVDTQQANSERRYRWYGYCDLISQLAEIGAIGVLENPPREYGIGHSRCCLFLRVVFRCGWIDRCLGDPQTGFGWMFVTWCLIRTSRKYRWRKYIFCNAH